MDLAHRILMAIHQVVPLMMISVIIHLLITVHGEVLLLR